MNIMHVTIPFIVFYWWVLCPNFRIFHCKRKQRLGRRKDLRLRHTFDAESVRNLRKLNKKSKWICVLQKVKHLHKNLYLYENIFRVHDHTCLLCSVTSGVCLQQNLLLPCHHNLNNGHDSACEHVSYRFVPQGHVCPCRAQYLWIKL